MDIGIKLIIFIHSQEETIEIDTAWLAAVEVFS